jgi:hypothetical protein
MSDGAQEAISTRSLVGVDEGDLTEARATSLILGNAIEQDSRKRSERESTLGMVET